MLLVKYWSTTSENFITSVCVRSTKISNIYFRNVYVCYLGVSYKYLNNLLFRNCTDTSSNKEFPVTKLVDCEPLVPVQTLLGTTTKGRMRNFRDLQAGVSKNLLQLFILLIVINILRKYHSWFRIKAKVSFVFYTTKCFKLEAASKDLLQSTLHLWSENDGLSIETT